MRSGGSVVLRRQESAGGRADPEDVKVVPGYELAAYSIRDTADREVYAGRNGSRRCDQLAEERTRDAQVLVKTMRIVRGIEVDVSLRRGDAEESIGGTDRQGAEEEDIDNCEHSGRRTYAQSERDQDRCRERSCSQQESYAIAQVLNQCLHMTTDRHADLRGD